MYWPNTITNLRNPLNGKITKFDECTVFNSTVVVAGGYALRIVSALTRQALMSPFGAMTSIVELKEQLEKLKKERELPDVTCYDY